MDGEKGLGLGMAAGGSKTVKSKNQSQLAARDQWMQWRDIFRTCKLAAIENSLTIDNGKNNRRAKRQQLVVLVGSQNSIAVTFQYGYPGFG